MSLFLRFRTVRLDDEPNPSRLSFLPAMDGDVLLSVACNPLSPSGSIFDDLQKGCCLISRFASYFLGRSGSRSILRCSASSSSLSIFLCLSIFLVNAARLQLFSSLIGWSSGREQGTPLSSRSKGSSRRQSAGDCFRIRWKSNQIGNFLFSALRQLSFALAAQFLRGAKFERDGGASTKTNRL